FADGFIARPLYSNYLSIRLPLASDSRTGPGKGKGDGQELAILEEMARNNVEMYLILATLADTMTKDGNKPPKGCLAGDDGPRSRGRAGRWNPRRSPPACGRPASPRHRRASRRSAA